MGQKSHSRSTIAEITVDHLLISKERDRIIAEYEDEGYLDVRLVLIVEGSLGHPRPTWVYDVTGHGPYEDGPQALKDLLSW